MSDIQESGTESAPAATAAAPAKSGSGLVTKAVALVVGVIAIGTIAVAGANFFKSHVASPSSAVIDSLVPSDMDGLLVVNIDPSVAQKANLYATVNRFPKLKTTQEIDKQLADLIDRSLKDLGGLTYGTDIKPWVGRTLAFAGQLQKDHPPAIVMISSKDDGAARAFLDKLRSATKPMGTWASHVHSGVTVWTITPTASSPTAGSKAANELDYAFLAGTVVLSDQSALLDEVIDTNAGKHAKLKDVAGFATAIGHLPSDRLVYGYLNSKALLTHAADLGKSTAGAPGLSTDAIAKYADAMGGSAFAVSARADGMQADSWTAVDVSKLDPAMRSTYTSAPHTATMLKSMPRTAMVAAASSGLKSGVHSLQSLLGTPAAGSVVAVLGDLKLTDPAGPLSHLGDDYGFELDKVATDQFPGGALMVSTDDPAGTTQFFSQLATAAIAVGSQFGSLTPRTHSAGGITTSVYKGTTIYSFALPGVGALGIAPAYAVTNGVAVIASSPAHVNEIVDAQTGANLTSSDSYKAALAGAIDPTQSVLYVDLQAVTTEVDSTLPADQRAEFDQWLTPLRSLAGTGRTTGNSSEGRWTLLLR